MRLIYKGRFYGVNDTRWDVEILKDQDGKVASVGELRFSGDEPLVIEWEEKGKEEVVCGSVATLTIISPGDRTYENLYTEKAGEIRMDVKKDGEIYWRGTLDAEFYEEPYTTMGNYEVTLTFQDFGLMDRLRYEGEGWQSLEDIIGGALTKCGMGDMAMEQDTQTLKADVTSALTLKDLMVMGENFVDSEGERMTLSKVVEGVLQPLALKLRQKDGKIWVYSYSSGSEGRAETAEWMSDDQTLGVDRVYNNIRVTWTPNIVSENLCADSCYINGVSTDLTSIGDIYGKEYGRSVYYTFIKSEDKGQSAENAGFTLWTSRNGIHAELVNDGVRYYKITPLLDGIQSEGIAVRYPSVGELGRYRNMLGIYYNAYDSYKSFGGEISTGNISEANEVMWRTDKLWLAPVEDSSELNLRITMSLLMDNRVNPFETCPEKSYLNKTILFPEQSQAENKLLTYNMLQVPVRILWYPDGEDAVWGWQSLGHMEGSDYGEEDSRGEWKPVVDSTGLPYIATLEYYDGGQEEDGQAVGGWKENKPCTGGSFDRVSEKLTQGSGQCVPYPTAGGKGGYLIIEVLRYGWVLSNTKTNHLHNFNSAPALWTLMSLPKIVVEKNTPWDVELDDSDVIYKAEINADAKEDMEIDTICGSADGGLATARGAYYDSQTYKQVTKLSRNGKTSQIEDLLIDSLYENFGSRNVKLVGTARTPSNGVGAMMDRSQGDRLMMVTGEVADVWSGESELTMVGIPKAK